MKWLAIPASDKRIRYAPIFRDYNSQLYISELWIKCQEHYDKAGYKLCKTMERKIVQNISKLNTDDKWLLERLQGLVEGSNDEKLWKECHK